MRFPSKEVVESLRNQYPAGTRVELVHMNDLYAPPIGTKGTVKGVDDAGSIMVLWDNGSGLSVAFGEDQCRKLATVKTICYGIEKVWDCRKEAMEFYIEASKNSVGSELERYAKIYLELMSGNKVCTDLPNQHICKYCGEIADGTDEDLLCKKCREFFGHALFSEL